MRLHIITDETVVKYELMRRLAILQIQENQERVKKAGKYVRENISVLK